VPQSTTPPPALSPLPWTYSPVTLDVDDANREGVAELYIHGAVLGDDMPTTHANGSLIAAAPELLATCRNALRLLYTHKEDAAALPGFAALYDQLAEALRKADNIQ